MQGKVFYHNDNKSQLDPRYQYYKQRTLYSDEIVSVTGKVDNLTAWQNRSEVKPGVSIPTGNEWIITARIPFSSFETLCQLPYVKSLQLAQQVKPEK